METPEFHPVAERDQVRPGVPLRIEVAGRRLLLIRTQEDSFHAVDEFCPHEEATLANGAVRDGCIACPMHGSRFDLTTGRPLEEPATEPLGVYPVRLEGDRILVCPEPIHD